MALRRNSAGGGEGLEGVLLARRQQELECRRKVLHPSVVDHWDGEHALAAHAVIADDLVVSSGDGLGLEQNAAYELRLRQVSSAGWVRVDYIKHVGELGAHVSVIAAAFLCAPLNAVAAGVAGQHGDQRISL